MVAYATLADVKTISGLKAGDPSNDDSYAIFLERVARYLDTECGRDFFRHPTLAGDPPETRIVRASGRHRRLMVRSGIISLSGLESATAPTGPWSAVAAAEWYLDPWDLPPHESYEAIVRVDGEAWAAGFYRPTGHFGFDAVPPLIVTANLEGARELERQGPGGGGPVGVNQFGTPLFMRGEPKSVNDAIRHYAWRRRNFQGI